MPDTPSNAISTSNKYNIPSLIFPFVTALTGDNSNVSFCRKSWPMVQTS